LNKNEYASLVLAVSNTRDGLTSTPRAAHIFATATRAPNQPSGSGS
jgi:hypothetical protein